LRPRRTELLPLVALLLGTILWLCAVLLSLLGDEESPAVAAGTETISDPQNDIPYAHYDLIFFAAAEEQHPSIVSDGRLHAPEARHARL
jgi:hypothetical protein